MSREFAWAYTFAGTEDQWDAYFEQCESMPFPHRHCQGGAGKAGKNEWAIWIHANRAKSRRIKRLLDAHFNQVGAMEKLP